MDYLRRSLALLFLVCLPVAASVAGAPLFSTKEGAIRGFDPVAYFEVGEPVEGREDLTVAWNGAVWHFANEEHRAAFEDDPEAYAPQYGGHCAYAMVSGKLVSTDPEAWAIVDGKLYLNYSRGVQRRWQKDTAGYIVKADEQWAAIVAAAMR